MQKVRMETKDGIEENIKKLAELFPNCVTEKMRGGGVNEYSINFDVLKQMFSREVIDGDEKYEFSWVGKKASIVEANQSIRKTLRPLKKESVNWDKTENLYIEGDNLEALKLLQESYLGKVKMIYIDPPYNTGKDFIYPDSFLMKNEEYNEGIGYFDEDGNVNFKRENHVTNGRYHSDWCSMIYSRLMVARNLLSEDGVIFISIDDNEISNLRKICDEIFGSSNFVSQITVVGNPRGRDYGGVARMHDYILVYKKTSATRLNLIADEENEFKMYDEWGGFELRELRNRNIKFNKDNRPNLYYPFYIHLEESDNNGLLQISIEKREGWLELFPLESQGINTVWRWGKEKAEKNLNTNIKAKSMKNGSYMIVEKYRESKKMARSVWWDKEANTEKGTLLVKSLMDGKVFDYPKPMEMLKRLCEMGTTGENEDIILDFFSGSATTAHAVMQLNMEDGGNRRFIMVQLPEKTDEASEAYKSGFKTISDIGKERIRRAGKRILEENREKEGIENLDIGFRVFTVDESNMKDVYYTPDEYTQMSLSQFESNIKEDRTDLDLFFGCILDWNLSLSFSYEVEEIEGYLIHNYNGGDLIACFHEKIPESVMKKIAKKQPERVVFRDSSFKDSPAKINVEELFKLLAPETDIRVI